MRRLPVYFLIDVSDSMVGKPIQSVQRGIKNALDELSGDPYALETAFINIIVFAGKVKKLVSMQELYKCSLPKLKVGSGTCFGGALDFLMTDIEVNVKRTTSEHKGDWKPLIFIITDGTSTDNPDQALNRWKTKFKNKLTTVVLALGQSADLKTLKEVTDDVLTFNELDEASFKQFFKWVSASVQASSACVRPDDSKKWGSMNPELLDRVVDEKKFEETSIDHPDEHYVILRARCQCKKKDYLIKYKLDSDVEGYSLEDTYPIDGTDYDAMSTNKVQSDQINVDRLFGCVSCPICENPNGLVICGRCGKLFCAAEEGICTCPWCGNSSELTSGSDLVVDRSLG